MVREPQKKVNLWGGLDIGIFRSVEISRGSGFVYSFQQTGEKAILKLDSFLPLQLGMLVTQEIKVTGAISHPSTNLIR
jgi:hypothetical protein